MQESELKQNFIKLKGIQQEKINHLIKTARLKIPDISHNE